MKTLNLLIFLLFSALLSAQNKGNCVTPISNYAFQPKLNSITSQKSDDQKLTLAVKLAKENCLSTSQVKDVAALFENDYNRLAFVQEAYINTTDKDNFYEVYNTFLYFSTVFRLHDFVIEQRGTKTEIVTEPVKTEMTFPDLQYPDFRKYYGKTGCKDIVNETEFMDIAYKVFNSKSEDSKLYLAKSTFQSRCFLTAQAMKMATLLNSEANRFEFLKIAYYRVYDPDNFKYANQLFKTESYKKELATFMGTANNVTTNDPPCEVNASEFQAVKAQINKESFNNTKINLAKQILKTKKCFKTTQIIEILGLFAYSDSKMDIAKFAYDYTTDKENYYKVADAFSFSNDKDALLNFLKTKQ
ncbi:MAG: DUF4476 domain-containing protein [Bacteroidales bacterium]